MTLRRTTTFVLGAGASYEFGLPLGIVLKEKVRGRLANFQTIENLESQNPLAIALSKINAQPEEIIAAGAKARAAIPMFSSIDDFLLQFKEQPLIGEVCRLAIAETILLAEKDSFLPQCLSPDPDVRGNANATASNTWIGRLFQLLTFKANNAQEAVENLSFIIFNYDRCVEVYMMSALRDAFGIAQAEAAEIASKVPIDHVYGLMGQIPEYPAIQEPISFGEGVNDLSKAASKIRTYGDGVESEEFARHLANKVAETEQLVVLGYAFHKQGVDLLFPNGKITGQQFHATTLNLGDRKNVFRDIVDNSGWISDTQCANLIYMINQLLD